MVIGVGKVSLHFDEAFSLKEKRMLLKSVMDKVKNKFNVAVAELAYQDKYQIAHIGISCISNNPAHTDSMLSKICNFIEADARILVYHIETELLYWD
jgi:uncharacterized protein YlxP (DUF503 family)